MSDPELECIIAKMSPELQKEMREYLKPENIRARMLEALPQALQATLEALKKFPGDRAKQKEYIEQAAAEHARRFKDARG